MKKAYLWLIGIFLFLVLSGFLTCIIFVMIMTMKNDSSSLSLSNKKIAIIDISGPIYDSEEYLKLLKKADKNSSVSAIVLRVNSPGGSVGASQEIYEEVLTIRKNGKIIVTSIADVGASGAYYIACASDKIVANPGTLTGSIGVIMDFMNWQGLMEKKLGVQFYTIKSGKFKDTGSPNRPMNDEEKQYLQDMINDAYQQFLQAVASGRDESIRNVLARQKLASKDVKDIKEKDINKTKSEVTYSEITSFIKPYAEGNIYTGRKAQEVGLVDELGSINKAIKVAADLSGIEGEPTTIKLEPERKGVFDKMFGEATDLMPWKKSQVMLLYMLK